MKRPIIVVALALVSLSGASAVAESTAQGACVMQGSVVDAVSGQQLANAQVFARSHGDGDSSVPVRRISNAKGEFCFEHLEAGGYIVTAWHSGYLDASYGAKRSGGAALVLEIAPGKQWVNLVVKMSPQAVIGGTVVDGDGDPISGAEVELVTRGSSEGINNANINEIDTDEEGRFRLWGLDAGRYYLRAKRESERMRVVREVLDEKGQMLRERYAETYYNGSLSLRGATPIVVKAGQEITGLTLSLQKTALRHVSGRVAAGSRGSEGPRVWVIHIDDNGEDVVADVSPQKDGTFRADGLLPGKYALEMIGPESNSNSGARMRVDLTERDADGIVFEPVAALNFQAVIRTDSGSANAQHLADRAYLYDAKSENGYATRRDEDGKLTFKNVAPAVYSVRIDDTDRYFVKRLLLDGEEQNGTTVDLRSGQSKVLEVVLSSNFGALTGTVLAEHPITSGIAVVLEEETGQAERRQAPTTTNGEFEWRRLPPGKYRLYAFEDFDEDSWNKDVAANLAAKSVALELHEGEKRQVKVQLISAKEFQDALRKAGL